MGNLPRVREAESAQKAALHREELERMADVSEESRKAAKARVSELQVVKKEIESEEPELEALRLEVEHRRSEAEKLKGEVRLLGSVSPPENAARLAEKIQAARQGLTGARSTRLEAEDALAAAEEVLSRLPDAATLPGLEERRKLLSEAERESEKARQALEQSEEERLVGAAGGRKRRQLRAAGTR